MVAVHRRFSLDSKLTLYGQRQSLQVALYYNADGGIMRLVGIPPFLENWDLGIATFYAQHDGDDLKLPG